MLHEHYDDERHEQGHDEYDSKPSWSIQKSNRLRLDDDTTRRADGAWTSNERMLFLRPFFFFLGSSTTWELCMLTRRRQYLAIIRNYVSFYFIFDLQLRLSVNEFLGSWKKRKKYQREKKNPWRIWFVSCTVLGAYSGL